MKKSYLLMAAASAIMLTACSSENDVLQTATPQETSAQAVGFDVFTPQAVTRAGAPEGVMTTDKLKTAGKGFGVFAFYHNNNTYPATNTSYAPNFMFNEQVHWASGWTYSPLKYWPNETLKDSQADPAAVMPGSAIPGTELDKLSFFAYAPYVSTGSGGTLSTGSTGGDNHFGTGKNAWIGSETYGISAISRETYTGDPLVEWQFSTDIDKNVDLLWGVAPAGNLTYTAVNGSSINKTAGLPLTNLVKPDKDQKIKFLFNHALSRIGFTVVSSIDQIAAGDAGGKFNSNQTRVLIDNVVVWGDFGVKGTLNLNNDVAYTANWIPESIVPSTTTEASPLFTFSVTNGKINPDLRYENLGSVTGAGNATDAATAFAALHPGVTPSEKPLLASGPENGIAVTGDALNYALGYKLYKYSADSKAYELATTTATEDVDVYTKDASDNYTLVKAKGAGTDYITMSGETPEYWQLTLSDEKTASTDEIAANSDYWTRTGTGAAGSPYVYTKHHTDVAISDATTYYVITSPAVLTANAYTGSCYTKLATRYFMVIPSKSPADASVVNTVNVKITYHVITNDGKLQGYVSDISNTVTKTETIKLQSGKSYNLKLILGLTSVKLDAEVADWQIGDDAEVYLPKNN